MTPTWANAECANGPKVMDWLTERVPGVHLHDVLGARARDWRSGRQAGFETLDRALCRLGFHPSELPEDVWEERKTPRRRSMKAAA